jgi:cysteine desulfurase
MTGSRIYLDYNASAPLLPSARAALVEALAIEANPSSVHAEGRQARGLIEAARQAVAALCAAEPADVLFTSGATEAAATLLAPEWLNGREALAVSHLYVSAADHPCLLSGGRFHRAAVSLLPVDGNGIADLDALAGALDRHDSSVGVPMVAIHLANNETGVIQPVARIAALTRQAGGLLVLDAVQAAGRIPLDISKLYADFLILSGHKIGGPKGVGAIVGRSDRLMPRPLMAGGGQERGLRAGTENLAGIAGFGAAAREARAAPAADAAVRSLRDRLEAELLRRAPEAQIFGALAERLPNTSLFALPGIKAETAQIAFDLAGIALSAGSACSSGKVGPSHVLKAMGHGGGPGGLRVSLGRATSEAEIERFLAALDAILARRTQAAA